MTTAPTTAPAQGTDEIHTLIMGRAITGIPAFGPPPPA